MASEKTFITFIVDQLSQAGEISYKPMFGEYGIYVDGKICALVCDNKLFIKPTRAGRTFMNEVVEAPPYPGAKPYFLVEEKIEDREWLCELVRISAQELPVPKKKQKKRNH